jgi:hypothetical protein
VNTAEGGASTRRPDYTSLRILASLCAAEIVILYVLIATETPATPLVRRLLETPSGVVVVVVSIVALLQLAMIAVLLLRRRAPSPTNPSGGVDR